MLPAGMPAAAMGGVRRVLAALTDALFPHRCMGCGRLFDHREREFAADRPLAGEADFAAVMIPHFCSTCRRQWLPVASPLCSRCGVMFVSRAGGDHLCGQCLEHGAKGFTRARAAGVYDQSLRLAIQALKFRGAVQLADPLGRLLFAAFRRHWPAGDVDVVAPVPLHRRRLRERGFNQAWLLLRCWPAVDGSAVVRDLLQRHRATAPQSGLDRRARRMNIRNAFSMARAGQSAGKRVLLVDDVLTTGATVNACADVLLRDGAARVDVLTVARVPIAGAFQR